MFQKLADEIKYFWEWISGATGEIYNLGKDIATSSFAVTMGFVYIVSQIWDFLIWVIAKIGSYISELSFPTLNVSMGGLGTTFAIANTFFPLTELFAVIVCLFGLKVAMVLYRLIKSWLWGS